MPGLTHAHAYCYARLAAGTRPRDRLTVSEWADRHRMLSSKQASERGRWRTSRNPILREIMDCLSTHSRVREVVVMKSSQVGLTEAMVNAIGYTVHHAPCPTLVLLPTIDARDAWKTQKLNPLLQDTDVVRDIIGGIRSRDAANSKDAIDFPGGVLFLAGGNSPNSYAQRSVSTVMLDDLDRFPGEIGEEGDPVALARGRCKAFPRSKLLLVSTPTIRDASLIEREYRLTDQRRYHVPCPACGTAQPLRWESVRWDKDRPPQRAWYECASCGHEIAEHHKPAMLARGSWVPERPDVKRRGYHVSALYAPIGLGPSWLDLATQFLVAQADPATLKSFINTHLGETWEDRTSALKTNDLERRMELEYDLGQIPPGVVALTAYIDTQDSWLDCHLLGWHEGGYRYVEWHQIHGDTARPGPWNDAAAWLNAVRVNAWGRPVRIHAAGVDSRGHRGQQVREFVQRPDLRVKALACQGSTSRLGRWIAATPSAQDKDRRGRSIRGGFGIWNIGTEFAKDYLYGHLVADGALPVEARRFRWPGGLPTEYFDGLLSETYNPETRRYEAKKGARYKRNEPLDGMVGCLAVGHHHEVLIGLYRNGKPDSGWYQRLRAQLEAEVAPGAGPAIQDAATRPAGTGERVGQAAPTPRRPAAPGIAKSDWSRRL